MLLSKMIKKMTALIPISLNGVGTGPYFKMDRYRRDLYTLHVGAMAAAATSKIELLQATDIDGTAAKGIPTTVGQLATATITANTKVIKATLTLAVIIATDAVTINGLTYTAAAVADEDARVFAVGADEDAAAVNLAAAINDPTYGVPGILASAALHVVTLTVINSETETTITVTTADATITLATVEALAYIEIGSAQLDTANGFEWVAAKVTNSVAVLSAVDLTRGDYRFQPVQQDGANAVL